MKIAYDLHIHSALSPCADDDMTPNNIVNMSLLKGLDVIAVTDHNSAGNLRAVCEAANGRLLVLPGIEAATAEEVHVLCYFPDVRLAEEMGSLLKERIKMKNKPEIFGRQLLMDKEDNIIGEEESLLCAAADIKLEELFYAVSELHGRAVFAHIDRQGMSVISNLGFIPDGIDLRTVEITGSATEEFKKRFSKYGIISGSDAHSLGDILEPVWHLDVLAKNTKEILKIL